jgi:hypothetical protein
MITTETFRKTTQRLAPAVYSATENYNPYPCQPVASGQIELGFAALARRIVAHERVVMDGMGGVLWTDFRERLTAALAEIGLTYEWLDVNEAGLAETDLNALIAPFLGGDDPIFGCRNTRPLRHFFDSEKLSALSRRAVGARFSMARVRPSRRPLVFWFMWTCPKMKSSSARAPAA